MTKKQLEELQEYSFLDNSEIGELNRLLLNISKYDWAMSEPLKKAVSAELEANYVKYRDFARIVKRKETKNVEWNELTWGE